MWDIWGVCGAAWQIDCNFGKGEGEARLCPCAVLPQQREEPGSGVPDSAGPSWSPPWLCVTLSCCG